MNKLFYFIVFLFAFAGYSQTQRQMLMGKVTTGMYPVQDALVINISSQKEVRTDTLGFFKMAVRAGDSIAVSDFKIVTKNLVLTQSDIKERFLHIPVASSSYEMEEIEINKYAHINSVSLGIVPAGMKLPTVAERRLNAGSSDPLGGLINLITGKTKMLKMNVEIEKRETALNKLNYLFDDAFFTEELKLTEELVAGFKYYVVESKKIRDELQGGERGIIAFSLVDLAKEYNKIVSDEK